MNAQEIASRAQQIAMEKKPTWKRGKFGGTRAQKEFADMIYKKVAVEILIRMIVARDEEHAVAYLNGRLAEFDRNSAKLINGWKLKFQSGVLTPEKYAEFRLSRQAKKTA